MPIVNGEWVPPYIYGATVRYYRSERLGMSQREFSARVFPDRGARGGQTALDRLENDGAVRLTEPEVLALEEAVREAGGDPYELQSPMVMVPLLDPVEGVRPLAGVVLHAVNEDMTAQFLKIGREEGWIPRRATVQRFPEGFVERDIAARFVAAMYPGPAHRPGRPNAGLLDWIWLARLERYLRTDDAETGLAELLDPAQSHYLWRSAGADLWPQNLLTVALHRIESIQSESKRAVLGSLLNDGSIVGLTHHDFERADRLARLAEAATAEERRRLEQLRGR